MKKSIILLLFISLISLFTFAESRELIIQNTQKTDVKVPQVFTFAQLLDKFGDDFDANWESLRVKDSSGTSIVYQITDLDGNGRISSDDQITFAFKNYAKIIVTDDFDTEALYFKPNFTVTKNDDSYTIENSDFTVNVSPKGLINFTKYGKTEGTLYNEIGIARIAGWSGSTYYVDGKLGKHVENTSNGFEVKSLYVSPAGPVSVTVKALLTFPELPGFNQEITSTVFTTGDIVVNNRFFFTNYVDLMKLQIMATSPLTSEDDKALHITPLFRRLPWAEQLGETSLKYWQDRNSVKTVNGNPYVVFNAIDSVNPLWWGATYIFASMESFRANYSESLGLAAVEILPQKNVIYSDFGKFAMGDTWVYESREFRDGIFRWIPDEFNLYESTKDVFHGTSDAEIGNNLMEKFKAGDSVTYKRVYSLYSVTGTENAINFLNDRAEDFQSVIIK